MKFLPIAAVIAAIGASPGLALAAGQPKLDQQETAAATNRKSPDQVENSKMDTKQKKDTQKYSEGSGNGKSGGDTTAPQVGGKKKPPP